MKSQLKFILGFLLIWGTLTLLVFWPALELTRNFSSVKFEADSLRATAFYVEFFLFGVTLLAMVLFSFRKIRAFVFPVFLAAGVVYISLAHYHLNSRVPFNLMALFDNSDVPFSVAWMVLKNSINRHAFRDFILFFILSSVGFYLLRQVEISIRLRLAVLVISLGLILMPPLGNAQVIDEFNSTFSYLKFQENLDHFSNATPTDIPWQNITGQIDPKQTVPHVFILFLESFNAAFVDKKIEGKEITPVFNQLKKRGLYFKNFYGNSVQTARGQVATMCGLIPSIREVISRKFSDRHINCLPSILKSVGYNSIFLKNYHDLEFDNSYDFWSKHGFTLLQGFDSTMMPKSQRDESTWGWGIRDDFAYIEYFKLLDTVVLKKPDQPIFVSLLSITNHMPFDQIPKDYRFFYPNPTDHYENYINSLAASDYFLKTFLQEYQRRDWLKNSILLVLGDHSYPALRGGSGRNDAGYSEEVFKTPLAIIDFRDKPAFLPQIIEERHSQLEVPATVIQLSNTKANGVFFAGSLLEQVPDYIPLIQPYSPISVSIISKNKKMTVDLISNKTEYHDLALDPDEKVNSIQMLTLSEEKWFRQRVELVKQFYYLLKGDLVLVDQDLKSKSH